MNKRGGSNKACSWEIFLKKNKKNSMLIRDFRVWPNPLLRRKRDWIFHHVVAKPQVVKNKIPHESRVALPRVTNGEFYPILFSPWWRTDIPILHTKFWISILHMWGIDIAWFHFSTVETISIPHTWGIDQFLIVEQWGIECHMSIPKNVWNLPSSGGM